jgi:hypothetical protein
LVRPSSFAHTRPLGSRRARCYGMFDDVLQFIFVLLFAGCQFLLALRQSIRDEAPPEIAWWGWGLVGYMVATRPRMKGALGKQIRVAF